MIMKYWKFGSYEIAAGALILVAVLLRLLLISQNWPVLDSDEGTMGIMALHIAYHGEHPIFFYGQSYMGVIQAYIAAFLFHLIGPSLFSLRLALVLLGLLFFVVFYLLSRTLYTKSFALVALALLALGSHYVLEYQLHVYGGYPETLLFGSLTFLLASWLALTSPARFSHLSLRKLGWRLLGYTGWGLAAGLGIWSDLLIAPFVLFSALLIALFCWRELLLILPVMAMLLATVAGVYPMIYYNQHFAAPDDSSLNMLQRLRNGSSSKSLHYDRKLVTAELKGTIQVSIPMMTGEPFCPVSEEFALHEPNSPHTRLCTLVHSTWGFGYLLLCSLAVIVVLLANWRVLLARWRAYKAGSPGLDERREGARQCARLLLLISALLSLGLYTFSIAPLDWPGVHARYLTGLLIATPVVLYPLWLATTTVGARARATLLSRSRQVVGAALLAAIGIVFLSGTIMTLSELPAARADMQQEQALISYLLRIHATHIYTQYWACDKTAFVSQEKITCAIVDASLHPTHNRVPHYYDVVSADPRAIYVYPINQLPVTSEWSAIQQKVTQPGTHYRRVVVAGYIIYIPE